MALSLSLSAPVATLKYDTRVNVTPTATVTETSTNASSNLSNMSVAFKTVQGGTNISWTGTARTKAGYLVLYVDGAEKARMNIPLKRGTGGVTTQTSTFTIAHSSNGTKTSSFQLKVLTGVDDVGNTSNIVYNATTGTAKSMTLTAITANKIRNWSFDSENFPNFVWGKSYKINIDSSTNCRAIPWLSVKNGAYAVGTNVDSSVDEMQTTGARWMALKINDGSTSVIPPGTTSFTIRLPNAIKYINNIPQSDLDKLSCTLSIDTYTGNFSSVGNRSGNIGNVRKTFDVYQGPGIWFNDNGTWRASKRVWFNDNGTWRNGKDIYFNDNGTWRKGR